MRARTLFVMLLSGAVLSACNTVTTPQGSSATPATATAIPAGAAVLIPGSGPPYALAPRSSDTFPRGSFNDDPAAARIVTGVMTSLTEGRSTHTSLLVGFQGGSVWLAMAAFQELRPRLGIEGERDIDPFLPGWRISASISPVTAGPVTVYGNAFEGALRGAIVRTGSGDLVYVGDTTGLSPP